VSICGYILPFISHNARRSQVPCLIRRQWANWKTSPFSLGASEHMVQDSYA